MTGGQRNQMGFGLLRASVIIAAAVAALNTAAQETAAAVKLDLKCDVVESRNGHDSTARFSLKIDIKAGAETGNYRMPEGVLPEGTAFRFRNKIGVAGYMLDLTDLTIFNRRASSLGSPTIISGTCKPAAR